MNHSDAISSLKVSPLSTILLPPGWPRLTSLSQLSSGTAVEVGSQNCSFLTVFAPSLTTNEGSPRTEITCVG